MLFVNFTALVSGKLLNIPAIASFKNIVYNLKNIRTGDLFIGKNSEIKRAIELGAYGVVSTNLKIKNSEIAWIEVDSIENTKLKLLRYLVIKSSLNIILLNDIEYQILLQLVDKTIFLKLERDSDDLIHKLRNLNIEKFIVSTDKMLMEGVGYTPSLNKESVKIDIIKNTLFLTTFRYKDRYYSDIKLPKIFINHLKNVLLLLDNLNINYSVFNLHFIKHFKPIFIDRYFRIKPFGLSIKVLILESDDKLLLKAIKYIEQNASWATAALITPKEFEIKSKVFYTYKNYSDIESIDISNLNFILIYDIKNKYEKYLIKKLDMDQKLLF